MSFHQSRHLLIVLVALIGIAGCAPRLAPIQSTLRTEPIGAPPIDANLQRVVDEAVARARANLQVEHVLTTLKKHRKSVTMAKWGTVGVSVATTTLGAIGSLQAEEKKGLAYATIGLGALTTLLTAVRDDADIARRIAVCEQVAQNGSKAIDTYQSTWTALIIDAPSPSEPEKRARFVNELVTATNTMVTTVATIMGTCH